MADPAVKLTKAELSALVECGSWKDGMHPGWRPKSMLKLEAKALVMAGPGRSAYGVSGDDFWHLTPAGRALLDALKDEGEGRG